MGQLRDEVGSLVAGTEDRATVGFPGVDHEYVAVEDGSRIEVVVHGRAGRATSECTFTSSLGSLRYEAGNAVLGYEGTGVFRRQDGNSVVVQSPSIAYRTVVVDGRTVRTLDVSAVDVATDGSVGGDDIAVVDGTEDPDPEICTGGTPLYHVDSATIRIENSDFYQGWYDYLREEFGHATKYDVNRTVVVHSVHLGQTLDGTSVPWVRTRRTGELLHPYDNSS